MYRPPGALDGRRRATAQPARRAPADERHHLGVLLTRRAPAAGARPARPADFYAAKGAARGAARAPRASTGGSSRASGRSCIRAARRPCSRPDERKLGWIGELHPLVARDVGPRASGRGFELDVDALAELAAPAPARTGDVTSFPAVLQDIAVVVGEDVPRGRRRGAVRGGGRRPARLGVAVFDVYRGEQVGEGNEVARAAARVPRGRPHAHRRRRGRAARRDRGAARRDRRAAPCASVAVVGAARVRAARSARALVERHPSLELTPSRRAATPAAASTTSTRATACR